MPLKSDGLSRYIDGLYRVIKVSNTKINFQESHFYMHEAFVWDIVNFFKVVFKLKMICWEKHLYATISFLLLEKYLFNLQFHIYITHTISQYHTTFVSNVNECICSK